MGGALEPMTYSCSMVTVLRVFIKDLFSGNNKWVGQGKRSGRSEGEGRKEGEEGTGEGRTGQREGIRDRQG